MEQQEMDVTREITLTIAWIATIFLILWGLVFASSVYAQRSYQQEKKPGGFIERLDADNDGKVSAEEFDGPEDHFSQIDRDGDGYIDESEQPTGPPCGKNGSRKNPIDRHDQDNDGKISMDEFPGPDHHFTMFDKDNDGYLDESEMPKGPPKRREGGEQGGPMNPETE